MNRTAYIATLTDDELTDELNLFREEMLDHVKSLVGWRNYEFYLLLAAAAQERSETRAALVAQAA